MHTNYQNYYCIKEIMMVYSNSYPYVNYSTSNFTCTVHRKYSNINPAIIRIRLTAQSHQKLNKTTQGKNQDNLIPTCIPGKAS